MQALSGSPAFKVQVMCEGIRYTEALGRAALHSMPNYYPYRFKAGEHDPTGKGTATIPYLINLGDGTEIRILGSGDSPWHVEGDRDAGLSADRRPRRPQRADRVRAAAAVDDAEDGGRPAVRAGRRDHPRRHAGDQRRAGLRVLPAQARRRLDALHVLRLRCARRAHRAPRPEDRPGRDPAADARAHARGAGGGDRTRPRSATSTSSAARSPTGARRASASCSSRAS